MEAALKPVSAAPDLVIVIDKALTSGVIFQWGPEDEKQNKEDR